MHYEILRSVPAPKHPTELQSTEAIHRVQDNWDHSRYTNRGHLIQGVGHWKRTKEKERQSHERKKGQ